MSLPLAIGKSNLAEVYSVDVHYLIIRLKWTFFKKAIIKYFLSSFNLLTRNLEIIQFRDLFI